MCTCFLSVILNKTLLRLICKLLLLASFCHWTAVCRSSQYSMAVFRNFKNQSQRYEFSRTYLEILKTNRRFRNLKEPITAFYDYIWLVMYPNKNAEILSGESSALEKIKIQVLVTTDKKRLRVALTVLEAVKNEFPKTKKSIENLMDEECQNEKISADEVIFVTSLEAKS